MGKVELEYGVRVQGRGGQKAEGGAYRSLVSSVLVTSPVPLGRVHVRGPVDR